MVERASAAIEANWLVFVVFTVRGLGGFGLRSGGVAVGITHLETFVTAWLTRR